MAVGGSTLHQHKSLADDKICAVRSWFQLSDTELFSDSCQSHLITNDEDSCFLCHAVGNVTTSERSFLRSFSARDIYRKHNSSHRSSVPIRHLVLRQTKRRLRTFFSRR